VKFFSDHYYCLIDYYTNISKKSEIKKLLAVYFQKTFGYSQKLLQKLMNIYYMLGISVIMPSYLNAYDGSRIESDIKFIRAVESFRAQTLEYKELIIVSDGCDITNKIYEDNWKTDPVIHLIKCEKSLAPWPGKLREVGRAFAKYNWISYLDTDDYILKVHLHKIEQAILKKKHNTTVLLNSHYAMPMVEEPNNLMLAYCGMTREEYNKTTETCTIYESLNIRVALAKAMGHNGTYQLVHHKDVPHRWENSQTIGEDKDLINRMKSTEQWEEFKGLYLICHLNNPHGNVWEI